MRSLHQFAKGSARRAARFCCRAVRRRCFASQAPLFNDSLAGIYEKNIGPFLFEPFARVMAGEAKSLVSQDAPLLEIAAGTGQVTAKLRDQLDSVPIVATDFSDDMLDVAKSIRGDLPNIQWQQADAHDLPFKQHEFGSAVCQFGVMFFADKPQAFREVRRVLRPGSWFLLSVWDPMSQMPIIQECKRVMDSFLPAGVEPPRFMDVAFGTAASDMAALLSDQGFEQVTYKSVALESTVPCARNLAHGMVYGSPALAEYQALSDVTPDDIVRQLHSELARRFGDEPLRATLSASFVMGKTQEMKTP